MSLNIVPYKLISFPKTPLLQQAVSVVQKLQKAGFASYLVGGCIRDQLLGISPQDYDIATEAKPADVEKIFLKTIPIGKRFGILVVREQGYSFEVATFRADHPITDGRRPQSVQYADAKQDVLRRDFTMNALLYDPIKEELCDFVGGVADIHQRTLRFVGDPNRRIEEDFLRILRAIRFKATFQLRFATGLKEAIQQHAHRIDIVSPERIRIELNKILKSPHRVQGIDELMQTGLLFYLLPEVYACKGVPQPYRYHQEGDVYIHLLECLRSLPKSTPVYLCWAVLLHDIGKPKTFSSDQDRIRFNGHTESGVILAENRLKALVFPKKEIAKITWLIAHHMHLNSIPQMKRVHQHALLTHPLFPALLKVFRADICGSKPRDFSAYREVLSLYKQEHMRLLAQPTRWITGEDVLQITGIQTGPLVGQIIQEAWEQQLEGTIQSKEEAKEWLRKRAILSSPKPNAITKEKL